jgi:hypothetical protein
MSFSDADEINNTKENAMSFSDVDEINNTKENDMSFSDADEINNTKADDMSFSDADEINNTKENDMSFSDVDEINNTKENDMSFSDFDELNNSKENDMSFSDVDKVNNTKENDMSFSDFDEIIIIYYIDDDSYDAKNEKEETVIIDKDSLAAIYELYNLTSFSIEETSQPMGFPRFSLKFQKSGLLVADWHINNILITSSSLFGLGNRRFTNDELIYEKINEIFSSD